jgi:hypothetical protein
MEEIALQLRNIKETREIQEMFDWIFCGANLSLQVDQVSVLYFAKSQQIHISVVCSP